MDKKRLVKMIAVSSVLSLSTVTAITLAGCGGDEDTHSHHLTEIIAVDATCTTNGNTAYYVCDGCDLIFSDAQGKQTTTIAETVVPKLNHDFTDGHHDADAATCLKDGNIEYWECNRCDLKFSDEQGAHEVTDVVTKGAHNWGADGHHAVVYPTVENEGTREYWECDVCNKIFLDSVGDKQTNSDGLKIARVKDNIDGTLGAAYNTEKAFVLGAENVNEGGLGIVTNAFRSDDGVYMHIVANYNVNPLYQESEHGKVVVSMNIVNESNLNLPGGAGVTLEKAMRMELYLTGVVNYAAPFELMHFDNKTNGEEAQTKYTATWEIFMPNAELATVNNGVFADCFQTEAGVTTLKPGHNILASVLGDFTKDENDYDKYDAQNGSKCDLKDGVWYMWYKEGYGDWDSAQKFMVVSKDGFQTTFERGTDTYNVNFADLSHATSTTTLQTSVDYDGAIEGTITIDEGYSLLGVRINGKSLTSGLQEKDDNVFDYLYDIEALGLAWNATEIDIEFVVIKLDYQDVTVTLKGIAGGVITNLKQGTSVLLESEFGTVINAEVGENGEIELSGVLCQEYMISVNDYEDGSVTIVKDGETATATLQYQFAIKVGTRPELIDLSEMNSENATITLGASSVNGVDQEVIAAQIKLSDEMKQAKAYVLYTTVKVESDVVDGKGVWLQRFGIRFAKGNGDSYNNKAVVWWDDLGKNETPSAIWANEETTVGGGGQRQETFDWLASNVLDGLQLKLVRNGEYVAVSVYNLDDEKWYTLLEGTTSADAENDITFFVSGECFSFSEIKIEKLTEHGVVLPGETTDGSQAYLSATNGDKFTLGGLMATEESLAIPAGALAYTEYDNIDIDSDNGTITINGNGVADRKGNRVNNATYILPDAVVGEKNIVLSFNVKDVYSPQGTDDWAARRFGIQIGAGAYGFYFWTEDEAKFNLNKFVVGTLDMNTDKDGQDVAQPLWAGAAIRSAAGLDVQIVRMDEQLVICFKNASGTWEKVGVILCSTNAETEIKFVGGGDNWVVSEIGATKLTYVAAKPASTTEAGNYAHYTDGTKYYLEDGTPTTADDVVIPQIVERNVDITVEFYDVQGVKMTDVDTSEMKISITGAYDYNKNIYTDLSVSEGKIVIVGGKMFDGKYTATLTDYENVVFDIDEENSTITVKFNKLYATSSNSKVTVDKENGVITINGEGLVNDNAAWSGSSELIISDEIKNSTDVQLEFTVKDTYLAGGGWDWAARRFGVAMQGGNGGFMCFTPTDSESSLYALGATPATEDKGHGVVDLAALVRSANGLKMRMTRHGGIITVSAEISSEWVLITMFECNAADGNNVVFYGVGDNWQFSEISVNTCAPVDCLTSNGSYSAVPNGNIDLEAEGILGYARYIGTDNYVYKGDVVSGGLEGHTRFGNDYNGDTSSVTFTAGETTNADCAYLDPGNNTEVKLHITKGATKIRIYTGTYQNNAWLDCVLSENGVAFDRVNFKRAEGAARTYVVEFTIDTSDWADDEAHDIVLTVGGTNDSELAAVVVLGE